MILLQAAVALMECRCLKNNRKRYTHGMSTLNIQDIQELSVAERIQLVEDIWDSIAATPETLPLTDSQRQELDRRLQSYQEDPNASSSWEEVKARLQS